MSDEATTLGKFNMSDFDDCEKLADDIKRRFMDMKWMAMNEIEEREAQPRLVLKELSAAAYSLRMLESKAFYWRISKGMKNLALLITTGKHRPNLADIKMTRERIASLKSVTEDFMLLISSFRDYRGDIVNKFVNMRGPAGEPPYKGEIEKFNRLVDRIAESLPNSPAAHLEEALDGLDYIMTLIPEDGAMQATG